jgi:DNA-binding transcriptional ArsR family regulator
MPPPDTPELIAALNHPLRRRILRAYLDGDFRTASSTQLAVAMGLPLGNVAYHVKTLSRLGVLRLVRSEKVRGAEERFYAVGLESQADCVRNILNSCRQADEPQS